MKPSRIAMALVMLGYVILGVAAAEPPANPEESVPAAAARTRYENAMKPAQDAFDRASLAAKRQYSRELGEAIKIAVREDKTDEVTRLKALQAGIDEETQTISARLATAAQGIRHGGFGGSHGQRQGGDPVDSAGQARTRTDPRRLVLSP